MLEASISNLRVSVGEALLELALRLDPSILHVFEVLRHVLHLVLEVVKVAILPGRLFNHFSSLSCLFLIFLYKILK